MQRKSTLLLRTLRSYRRYTLEFEITRGKQSMRNTNRLLIFVILVGFILLALSMLNTAHTQGRPTPTSWPTGITPTSWFPTAPSTRTPQSTSPVYTPTQVRFTASPSPTSVPSATCTPTPFAISPISPIFAPNPVPIIRFAYIPILIKD